MMLQNKWSFVWLSIILLLGFSAAAQEPGVFVFARAYTHSCAYYSNTYADFEIYFTKPQPPGSKVFLRFGYGGYQSPAGSRAEDINLINWHQLSDLPMNEKDGVWKIYFEQGLQYRSSPQVYDRLQFAVRIVHADGTEIFEKGNSSTFGYFEAKIPEQNRPCINTLTDKPKLQQLKVIDLIKW